VAAVLAMNQLGQHSRTIPTRLAVGDWLLVQRFVEFECRSVQKIYCCKPESAQRPAPSRATLSFAMTLTGMASKSGCMRPLETKAFMKAPEASLGRILGALPPAR